jgi:hypothetical protein
MSIDRVHSGPVTDADGDVGGIVKLLALSPIFDVDGLQ